MTDSSSIRSSNVRVAARPRLSLGVLVASSLIATAVVASTARAQTGVGATITPYAGYLITGDWYDGPVGSNLSTTNAPMVGVQGSVPLTRGISLVGNLAYGSGDLRVGLPLIGGFNVGTVKTWLYDAGLELGGLGGKARGLESSADGLGYLVLAGHRGTADEHIPFAAALFVFFASTCWA